MLPESLLTVPGIRYVIDSGTARMSRYSAKSKIQRLPIEPVSQASANQRAGRCGRVGPGICVRLFSLVRLRVSRCVHHARNSPHQLSERRVTDENARARYAGESFPLLIRFDQK